MNTQTTILNALGITESDCYKIDQICSGFGIDLTEEMVLDAINENITSVANTLIARLYDKVISEAGSRYDNINISHFEADSNGEASRLTYKGDTIDNWEDLKNHLWGW